jgi:5'-3' exonuclease
MGVPGFFRELIKLYPHIIRNSVNGRVSHLFLDYNCLLHPQCFKILALNIDETDPDRLYDKMIKRILAFTDYLENFINPSELFYVAIDGVAPEAKISQQRQRRFGYANDYRHIVMKKHNVPHNSSWSNIVITPGTEFMHKTHLKLKAHFARKAREDTKDKSCSYVYSSYLTPGEGEHKILQYIKKNIPTNHKDPIVIYGLDADLIFLAMSSQYSNLYLLREADQLNQARADHDDPNNVGEELLFVDIDVTKESINSHFNSEFDRFTQVENDVEENLMDDMFGDGSLDDDSRSSDRNERRSRYRFDFCNDYIFICYFLGNDFLPHLPSVDIKINGMKMVMDSYMSVVERRAETMIKYDKSGKIRVDPEFMYEFICSMAAKEDHFFRSTLPDDIRKRKRRRCYESEKYKRDIWEIENLRATIDGHGRLQKLKIDDPIRLGEGQPKDWKSRYYEHYFHADYRQQEMIDKICENYVEGLYWVARYYFEECPTWRWQYRYAHPPFLSDIMQYLERTDIVASEYGIEFTQEKPLDMYTQLVSVIPQRYAHILPYSLQSLSGSANSPVIDMYPTTYPLDMINKTILYKCVPHIPYLDVTRIERAVRELKLTEKETIRAIGDSEFLFKRAASGTKPKSRKTESKTQSKTRSKPPSKAPSKTAPKASKTSRARKRN